MASEDFSAAKSLSEQEQQSERDRRYIPPWKEPYVIALAGSSGSGKTSIAQAIIKKLNVPWSVLLSMDNFYKPLNKEQQKLAFESKYDFDSPDAIDLDLCVQVLSDLKNGKRTRIPHYSFTLHQRTDQWTTIFGANIIVLEGIYALHDPRVLALTDLKIFVDTSLDVCLARRLTRDIVYRGREIDLSVLQWQRFVKPNFERYVRPSTQNADVRIPRGIDNVVAIDLLMAHVQRQLEKKSLKHLRDLLSLSRPTSSSGDAVDLDEAVQRERDCVDGEYLSSTSTTRPPNVIVLQATPQIRALHTFILACGADISSKDTQTSIHTNCTDTTEVPVSTIIRKKNEEDNNADQHDALKKFFSDSSSDSGFNRADFVFHFDRLAMLLIDRALDEFSYGPGSPLHKNGDPVITPGGYTIENATKMISQPAAVQLIRGGECFDTALRKTIRDIPLGKILIQSDARTGEPHLHAVSLPPCVDPRVKSSQDEDPEDYDEEEDFDDNISQTSKSSERSVVELNSANLAAQRRTKILLCDSQLSSGAAATMSVAILLDHGIREENIVVIAYMATQMAVRRLYAAFPKIKIVVGVLTQAVVPRFVDNVYFGTV